MSLAITCPSCQTRLRVRDQLAGKEIKCPRCSAPVSVPAEDQVEVVSVDAVQAEAPAPTRPAAVPARPCPECGKRIPTSARKCRYCGTLVEDEEEDEPPELTTSPYVPCPKCNAPGPEKVVFTFWGSFYGPALLSHVRCQECGYCFNGKTGGSNLLPAIVFVTIPALLILLILAGLVWMVIAMASKPS